MSSISSRREGSTLCPSRHRVSTLDSAVSDRPESHLIRPIACFQVPCYRPRPRLCYACPPADRPHPVNQRPCSPSAHSSNIAPPHATQHSTRWTPSRHLVSPSLSLPLLLDVRPQPGHRKPSLKHIGRTEYLVVALLGLASKNVYKEKSPPALLSLAPSECLSNPIPRLFDTEPTVCWCIPLSIETILSLRCYPISSPSMDMMASTPLHVDDLPSEASTHTFYSGPARPMTNPPSPLAYRSSSRSSPPSQPHNSSPSPASIAAFTT